MAYDIEITEQGKTIEVYTSAAYIRTLVTYNASGGNCSGADGGPDRILTLNNNPVTVSSQLFSVYADGRRLPTTEYTATHQVSGTRITFLGSLWNDDSIVVDYTL